MHAWSGLLYFTRPPCLSTAYPQVTNVPEASRCTDASSYPETCPKTPPAHSKGPQGNLNIPSCTAIPSTNLKKSVVLNADWYSLLLTINDHFVQWPWYAFLCFFSDMHHVEERCSREFSHPITTTWAAAQMRASCLLRCSPRLCWVPCTLVT